MARPEPVPPGRRGIGTVLYTLVGFVAGCAAMLGSLALLHAQVLDRGQATASPSAMTGSAMADTLSALEEHLPKSVGPCEPGNLRPATEGSIYASVVCHPTGVPVLDLQYMTVHDAVALRDLFHGQLSQYHIKVASRQDASRVCATTPPHGAFRWYGKASGDQMTGAVMHAFDRSPGSTHGSAVCYVVGERAWLDWIDGDTHIYAFASTSLEAYPALFQWWLNEAGPDHPRHQPMPTSASPSAMEPSSEASM